MNSVKLLATALLSAAALFSAQPAQSATNSKATGYPTSTISVTHWDGLRQTMVKETIMVGTSRKQVTALLGQPMKELAPNLVQYDNCRPNQRLDARCRQLVIAFTDGKVSSMTFANSPMVEQLAAQAHQQARPEDIPAPERALALPN